VIQCLKEKNREEKESAKGANLLVTILLIFWRTLAKRERIEL